jgi:uncharacterized cupin superfamily protein
MKAIHLDEVPCREIKSPKGLYQLSEKDISLALGGKKDVGPWGGGHPFDLALVRIPPGCKNWPVHQHAAQWEVYYIVEGSGRYFDGAQWHNIRAGHTIMAPPGEAHQIENSGTGDLSYLVIADMPAADNTFYPATGLINIKPQRKIMQMSDANYYDGHE